VIYIFFQKKRGRGGVGRPGKKTYEGHGNPSSQHHKVQHHLRSPKECSKRLEHCLWNPRGERVAHMRGVKYNTKESRAQEKNNGVTEQYFQKLEWGGVVRK